jgi:tetratricopeptide (TPR) repeat protein
VKISFELLTTKALIAKDSDQTCSITHKILPLRFKKFFMRNTVFFFILLFLTSCAALHKTPSKEVAAESATSTGMHEKALALWEQIIAEHEQAGLQNTSIAYDKAGHSALAIGDTLKSENYFKLSMYYQTASVATYSFLIDYYQKTNNLSREVMALEGLLSHYPQSQVTAKVMPQLFQLYTQTQQWESAEKIWPLVKNEYHSENLVNSWLNVNKALDNKDLCDDIASQLLALNPKNRVALEWNAKKYYDKGEQRFQMEMEAYEKNKTRSQYASLLKGLEVSTDHFQQALKLFEMLHKTHQDNSYALYISNIYARFGDEKNSMHYRSMIKND